jgi:hypothetical protein
VAAKQNIFDEGDWTGQITLNAFRKLVFARSAFRRKLFVPKADQFTYPARSGKSVRLAGQRM